jgi:hypothetical protein
MKIWPSDPSSVPLPPPPPKKNHIDRLYVDRVGCSFYMADGSYLADVVTFFYEGFLCGAKREFYDQKNRYSIQLCFQKFVHNFLITRLFFIWKHFYFK